MAHSERGSLRENTRYHTLDILSEQRSDYVRGVLRELGQDLKIADSSVREYFSSIDPELRKLSALGSPEDLIPQEINPDVHSNVLYMTDDDTWKMAELRLMGEDAIEYNLVATLRSIYMIFRLGAPRDETVRQGYCMDSMTRCLTERALLVAGKYDLQLPQPWMGEVSRSRIDELLMGGIRDRSRQFQVDQVDEETMANMVRQGISREHVIESIDHMNRVMRRERTYALKDFFEKTPDPRQLADQILDGTTLEAFAKIQEGSSFPA